MLPIQSGGHVFTVEIESMVGGLRRRSAAWIGLFGVGLMLVGCAEGRVVPPTEFTEFVSKDRAFALDYPAGWDSKAGARPDNTYSWAEFSKGSVTIRVIADTSGSLMAGVPGAFDGEMDEELAPVARAHDLKRDLIADDFTNYREGPPRAVQSKLGDTRIARFAADGSFKGRRSGFRCTMLTLNRRITVLCHCPASQFDEFQAAFESVILSVRRG